MFRRNNRLRFLIAGFSMLLFLILLLFFSSPLGTIGFGFLSLPSLFFFFPLVFLTVYFFVITAFPSGFHGLLVASFSVIFFIFRMNSLTNPLFFILLLILLLILEVVLYKK